MRKNSSRSTSQRPELTCQMCGVACTNAAAFGTHLKTYHPGWNAESYYVQYLSGVSYYDPHFGTCPVCSSPTNFRGLKHGYSKTCSASCAMKLRYQDPEYMEYWRAKKSADSQAVWNSPSSDARRAAMSKRSSLRMKKLHKDPEFAKKVRAAASEGLKKMWRDPERRQRTLQAFNSDSTRDLKSRLAVARLKDPTSRFGLKNRCKWLYDGREFRSSWEAKVDLFLDHIGLEWQYEPETFELGNGRRYTPDFFIPSMNLFIEVKPNRLVPEDNLRSSAVKSCGYGFKYLTEKNWKEAQTFLRAAQNYINRAGDNLSAEDKSRLEHAKSLLEKKKPK